MKTLPSRNLFVGGIECGTFLAAGSYTLVYNVLDYPGGVVRMTSITEDDNELMRNYPDHDKFHRKVKEVTNKD